MEEVEAKDDQQLAANSGIPISESDPNPPSTCQSSATDPAEGVVSETESESPKNRTDIFRAVEVVERDSIAIAESFSTLFDSLRLVLSEVTSNSVDHMHCFSDAAGRLQESVLDAATKGNRYINSCLRLNQEMKGIDSLAAQLDSFHCEIHWCSWDGGSTQRPPYWEFKRKSLGLEQDLICSPNSLRFWASHYSVTVCQWAINQMVINAILGIIFHVPLPLQFLNAFRKILRRNVDALDVAVNKLLHIP